MQELNTKEQDLVIGCEYLVEDAGGFLLNRALRGKVVIPADKNVVLNDPGIFVKGLTNHNDELEENLVYLYVPEINQFWCGRKPGCHSKRYPNPAAYAPVAEQDSEDEDSLDLDLDQDIALPDDKCCDCGESCDSCDKPVFELDQEAKDALISAVKSLSDSIRPFETLKTRFQVQLALEFREIFFNGPATIGFYTGVDGKEHKVICVCDERDRSIMTEEDGRRRIALKAMKREVRRALRQHDKELTAKLKMEKLKASMGEK